MTGLASLEVQLRGGDAAGARAALDALLARPDLPTADRVGALKLRARAHEALSNLRMAIADVEGVLALAPRDAQAMNELGILRADAGETERALDSFRRAVALEPGYARAWNNVGNAERAAGNLEAAETAFARATAVDPSYALAWANLGAIRRERGDVDGADAALTRALALDPNQRVALQALAGLRRQQGALDVAVALYTQAAQRDPRDANVFLQLGGTLSERDDLAAARSAYDAALARDPGLLRAVLGRALTLPMVLPSAAGVAAVRTAYAEGLATLERELPAREDALSGDRTVDELRWTNFLLAYQGENDKDLQSRYGDLVTGIVARRAPAYARAPARRPRGDRLRVGFLSAFFRDGTVGRYFERWITDLSRERFEVHLFQLSPDRDEVAARLAARADVLHACPRWRPSQVAPRVRSADLDVLAYPEVGMDATTFALAALRLAPRQCVAWGHPVTTGLPTLDAFFTCSAMEPPDADAHYREPVVRLPGLGTRYALPTLPSPATRETFGLPEDGALLLCPQSLFKIHPDNDALLARVLAAAPRSHLVLFEGRHPALTAAYLARLDAALSAEGLARAGRVHVLPQCAHQDYLRINALCDAMLDTLHWSGGNTTLDALAAGLPVVTVPGRFMRGRQSAAMLELIGVTETIASDADAYVRIAARVAREPSWREEVAARVVANRDRLFDDPRPIDALADALLHLAGA